MKVEKHSLAVTDEFLREIRTQGQAGYKLATLELVQQEINTMARTKLIISDKNKPIMSAQLEEEIEAAMVQYLNAKKWIEWGMADIRKQGNCVFLYGPPGTGKTVIASYMSKRIGRGMVTINMKDVGGKAPGHTERMVQEKFSEARTLGGKTIYMDECEAIAWDRGRAGSDSMWMVGVIDEILMQVAKYPYLVVMSSNRPDILDPALMDRCFASLQVGMPEAPERIRLWRQKMPERFPLKLTQVQIEQLSEFAISGRQIETCIVREASRAIHADRFPNFAELLNAVKAAAAK
jgi:AAA+ superfamily predicted ATPase